MNNIDNTTLEDFWSKRKVQIYSDEDISYLLENVPFNFVQDLKKIGNPVIKNEYYSFLPVQHLKIDALDNISFLKLGSFFKSKNTNDNIALLDVNDGRVLFYSESFYKLKLAKSKISVINRSYNSFLQYEMEFLKFIEAVFSTKEKLSFNLVKMMLAELVRVLNAVDAIGLQKLEKHYPFWRKKIYDISFDIEEQYEEVLPDYFRDDHSMD